MGTRLVLLGLLAIAAPATHVPGAEHGHDSPPSATAHGAAGVAEESAVHHETVVATPAPDAHPSATTKPARPTLVQRHGPIVPLAFAVGLLALLGSLYARGRDGEPGADPSDRPSDGHATPTNGST